jgi:hypothetical protein
VRPSDPLALLALTTLLLCATAQVRDVSQEAEDSHFVAEEAVTAVAAADEEGDELAEEVLAQGDPQPSPAEAAAAAAAEAAAAATMERAGGRATEAEAWRKARGACVVWGCVLG